MFFISHLPCVHMIFCFCGHAGAHYRLSSRPFKTLSANRIHSCWEGVHLNIYLLMIYPELWSRAVAVIAARCPFSTALPWCTVLSSLFTIIHRYSSQIHFLFKKSTKIIEIVTDCKAQSFANYTAFSCTDWNLWCCGLCCQKYPTNPGTGILEDHVTDLFLQISPSNSEANASGQSWKCSRPPRTVALRTATCLDCEIGQYPHYDDDTVMVVVVLMMVMVMTLLLLLLLWLSLLLSSLFLSHCCCRRRRCCPRRPHSCRLDRQRTSDPTPIVEATVIMEWTRQTTLKKK